MKMKISSEVKKELEELWDIHSFGTRKIDFEYLRGIHEYVEVLLDYKPTSRIIDKAMYDQESRYPEWWKEESGKFKNGVIEEVCLVKEKVEQYIKKNKIQTSSYFEKRLQKSVERNASPRANIVRIGLCLEKLSELEHEDFTQDFLDFRLIQPEVYDLRRYHMLGDTISRYVSWEYSEDAKRTETKESAIYNLVKIWFAFAERKSDTVEKEKFFHRMWGWTDGFLDEIENLEQTKEGPTELDILKTLDQCGLSSPRLNIKIAHRFFIGYLSTKDKKAPSENCYVTKKGDDFFYKGKNWNLSKKPDYYKVFSALYAKLPKGGEIPYNELIAEVKSRIPKVKNKSDKEIRALIHRNLTEKKNGFRRATKIPKTEDSGKPLIRVVRGQGIEFNNKMG